MVSIETVRSTNKKHFQDRPLVAVFVGATSGIGEYSVRELAKIYSAQQKTSLRVYIVGRNQTAADAIIVACSKLCSEAVFHFVAAQDLALIQEVDKTSDGILRFEQEEHKNEQPRIDLLVMTQGKVVFGGRQDTNEGLDRTMSLIYYSRIRLITNLLPLLLVSQPSASIISVYGAGLEGKLFASDLSLRDAKHYDFNNARSHITHFTTMAFERLAREHHGRLSLVHVFPGIVVTPAYVDKDHPWWFKLTWGLVGPFVQRFKAIGAEESGHRILYLATGAFGTTEQDGGSSPVAKGTDGVSRSGAYAVGENSEPLAVEAKYKRMREDGFETIVWEHTTQAFKEIEAGRRFSA